MSKEKPKDVDSLFEEAAQIVIKEQHWRYNSRGLPVDGFINQKPPRLLSQRCGQNLRSMISRHIRLLW